MQVDDNGDFRTIVFVLTKDALFHTVPGYAI
jgi:hypothetical protein